MNVARSFRGIVAVGLFLTVGGFCFETVSRASHVAEIIGQVSVESYTAYLQNDLYAHDGDERYWGSQHDLARQNIQDRFEGFGLSTSLDPFVCNGVECANVVAVLPGVTRPDETYVLGAHYDSVAGSPGAHDNAGGVAGVLEAARVLSQYRFETTIVFIAFDREERGLAGSKHYAEEHRWDRIRGMISLDCIAYEPCPPGDPDYGKVGVRYSDRRTDITDDLVAALGSYAGLTGGVGRGSGSDHGPFDDVGFDSALLVSYSGCSPFRHKASDSVDGFADSDYKYGTKVTRGVVGYLATQAGVASVRLFPDFNGDWKVDIEDLTLLIEHWDQNDPNFDIAPPPMGDGVVDRKDLEVLMSYWGQEGRDPTLLAHWTLDEAEGVVADDSTGANDADVVGNPIWQPAGGKLNGALQFDGIDDYISTPFVLDPAEGPFSILAWVKGGAPGQVILSQTDGANWVLAAAPGGELTTELKSNRKGALSSSAIVTDGAWHHVGFVRDNVRRILYVDGIEVARDITSAPVASSGGLLIGAGSQLAPGTFWSGLIDDVRIYNRAVKP